MMLKRITVNDFKRYVGTHEYLFDKINLISGDNGSGKSTLALHALLFVIHGYSENKLEKLAPRNLANPNTWVEVELTHLGNTYIIRRSIPTQVSLKINGVESTLANNELKKAELVRLFGNIEYFRKFRMIDIKASINILEQGNTDLRKTLVNLNDVIDLTAVRQNLLLEKNNRELYNKDTSVIYKHYPSVERLQFLHMKHDDLTTAENNFRNAYNEAISALNELQNRVGRQQGNLANLRLQKSKLTNPICITCGQTIKIDKQQELLGNVNSEIISTNETIASLHGDLATQKEFVTYINQKLLGIAKQKNKLQYWINRLNVRLTQSDYVWTTSDVEIVKLAIKEVDGFSTYYITQRLKMLEPLINNFLNKVGFSISFSVDIKNNLEIQININGQDFNYTDLSNGERLLVTTAFQLALLMEKNETGLIIADEGFSSLAENNLDIMFDMFINSPFQLVAVVHRYTSNNPNVRNIYITK